VALVTKDGVPVQTLAQAMAELKRLTTPWEVGVLISKKLSQIHGN
jgi:hypothetical protein